jgi:uncharacterized protein
MSQVRKNTNRLAGESSPYLLQHAHNPVNWFPWGQEAFEKAKAEAKPIFLSIGYATCHWCHVMEKESFEDEEIARYLNDHYVAIKVDREQRPDLDAIYMAAVQTLTGHGGWPMSVFLKPDGKPFYGGTYFPARDGDRGAGMGFLSLLKRLHEIYANESARVNESSDAISEAIRSQIAPDASGSLPSKEILRETWESFRDSFDPQFGGFGPAPKFPRPSVLLFLLQYWSITGEEEAKSSAFHTLRSMARGGMHDQIGGGFHRYSTDRIWLVPHFEKMLYDNAQLAIAYLDAFRISRDPEFRNVARKTLDYVLREMTDESGGFYSATDADSEGEEGTFFVWTREEIENLLGKEEGDLVCRYFGVTAEGNFEGKNILHVVGNTEDRISKAEAILYEARKKRIPPITDDKVLTAWNGLMIAALSRGGFDLGDSKYIDAARRAGRFVSEKLTKDGRLLRCYRKGKSELNGYSDDYACVVYGYVALYEATFEAAWLEMAIQLQETQIRLYWDETSGGFFMTSNDHENLLAREKPYYDGAEPSSNSLSAWNLLRLESITGQEKFGRYGRKTIEAFARVLDRSPSIAPWMVMALGYHHSRAKEIVLAANEPFELDPFLDRLRTIFIPNSVLSRGKDPIHGKATAYVCEKGTCKAPVQDPDEFVRLLIDPKA